MVHSAAEPPGPQAEIEPVDAAALDADGALWRLYEASFPSSEREPVEVIRATVAREAGFVLRARTGQTTVGMSVAHLLSEPAATFLVYLAVDPAWRSRRLGSALFESTASLGSRRLLAAGRRAVGVVWEIDDPELAVEPLERDMRLRRLAFFEHVGGQLLPVPYVQPAVDGRAPVPMRLMFRPEPGGIWPGTGSAADLIRAIYFEKYHAMNGIPRRALEGLLAN